jgi:hypothetical protein
LSWPGVSGAIVGARSREQVDGWIAAGNLTLDATDLAEIAGALKRTQAGAGPTRPVPSTGIPVADGSSTDVTRLGRKAR